MKHSYPPPLLRHAYPCRARSNLGAILSLTGTGGSYGLQAAAAEDLAYMEAEFYGDGSESVIDISMRKSTDRGIYDLTWNGTAIASAVDGYAAAAADGHYEYSITVIPGRNVLRWTVNGKNGASSDYAMMCLGAAIQ